MALSRGAVPFLPCAQWTLLGCEPSPGTLPALSQPSARLQLTRCAEDSTPLVFLLVTHPSSCARCRAVSQCGRGGRILAATGRTARWVAPSTTWNPLTPRHDLPRRSRCSDDPPTRRCRRLCAPVRRLRRRQPRLSAAKAPRLPPTTGGCGGGVGGAPTANRGQKGVGLGGGGGSGSIATDGAGAARV